MLSDIEIAQATTPKRITEVAKAAGVPEQYLELYGNYKAKVDYNLLTDVEHAPGKLILVTAINPTPAGEGKTTTFFPMRASASDRPTVVGPCSP